MAWLALPPSAIYQIAFRFAERQFKRSLDAANPQLAEKALLLRHLTCAEARI